MAEATVETLKEAMVKEYLLTKYCQRTGKVINMAEFTGGYIENTPIKLHKTYSNEPEKEIYRGYVEYRDETLRTQQIEVLLSREEYQELEINKGRLDLKLSKHHKLQDAVEYLRIKYIGIEDWVKHHEPVHLSLITTAGPLVHRVILTGIPRNNVSVTSVSQTFKILKADFHVIETLMSAPKLEPDPQSKKNKFQAMPKHRHNISLREMAKLMDTKYYGDLTMDPRKNQKEPTLALICSCPDGFLCKKVSETIDSCGDISYWYEKAPLPKPDNPKFFHLVVPVVDHVLYSFRVQAIVTENWSGIQQQKLVAYGMTEGETFFYDMPRPGDEGERCPIMANQRAAITEFSEHLGAKWANPLSLFVAGRTTVPICLSVNHTYGINTKLKRFLQVDKHYSKRYVATALTMELYEVCYICYQNATPAFSLLPDDLF